MGIGQSLVGNRGAIELRTDKLLEQWESPDVIAVDFIVFYRRPGFVVQGQ